MNEEEHKHKFDRYTDFWWLRRAIVMTLLSFEENWIRGVVVILNEVGLENEAAGSHERRAALEPVYARPY